MSRRISFSDFIHSEEDLNLNSIISDESEKDNSIHKKKARKILLKIINNELTERQKQIIMLYYFKNMNIVSIADMLKVSPASVSVTMKRARNNIIKYMKYYF